MADDVRARPTVVTAPMTHLSAGLAPPDFEPDLAGRCFTAEEYPDCGCAEVDLGFEAERQSMPTLGLSAPVTRALARHCVQRFPRLNPHTDTTNTDMPTCGRSAK
ncbi:MAG: hypothetical protein QOI78_3057 [Actinomycetota bacterium]|jgi:hypothetical protein|nr:hypothetical protein [Actinomycetota bacterium]